MRRIRIRRNRLTKLLLRRRQDTRCASCSRRWSRSLRRKLPNLGRPKKVLKS